MAIQGKPDVWCKQEIGELIGIGEWIGMENKKSWTKQKTENKIKRPVETEHSKP